MDIIRAEPSRVLRLATLREYVRDADPSIHLILSFQVEEMWEAPEPRFNTIVFKNFGEDVATWFHSQTRTAFFELPYISQCIIHKMGTYRSLGLSLNDVANVVKYESPFLWLSQYAAHHHDTCNLCGVASRTICTNCYETLKQVAEFRHERFTWVVSPDTMRPFYTQNYGEFRVVVGNYVVQRRGLYEIEFIPSQGQLLLPFEEYQKNIKIL